MIEGAGVLTEMGMQHMVFEAVVLRHPDRFSAAAVKASRERLRARGRASCVSAERSRGEAKAYDPTCQRTLIY
jgi:hypothetical protein